MGYANRSSATDLAVIPNSCAISELSDVHEFNFYQLVELIHRYKGTSPENDDWERHCELVFNGNPSLGFSISDIAKIEEAAEDYLVLTTNFLGLSGTVSPLPSYMVESLLHEEANGLKKPFFDFFNNRVIALTYRIWRKYRYHIRFESGAVDQLSSQIFALVGLSDPSLRGDTPINWSKMLSYAGLLVGRSRSAKVVSSIIAHYFDLEKISIRELVKRTVHISPEQIGVMGVQNMVLGSNTILGDRIDDINGKFVICLSDLTRKQFEDFLPSGGNFYQLHCLIEFFIRDQLAYDIELTLLDNVENDDESYMALGWTSFLGGRKPGQSVLIQGRQ